MARRKKVPQVEPVEIDFHGWRPDEVCRELHRLVERLAGGRGTTIRVIHGRGAGILAAEVEQFARNDPRVASAEKDFFNPGITTLVLNGKTAPPRGHSPSSARTWEQAQEPPIRKRKR